jgi:hypothetical protein
MRTKFLKDREIFKSSMKQSDVLFHVERHNGTVEEFRKGDLAIYRQRAVTVIDVPDTVMGHFKDTPAGRIICLDICTVMVNGVIKNVQTEEIFHIRE